MGAVSLLRKVFLGLSGSVSVFYLVFCALSNVCLPATDCRPHLPLLLLRGRVYGLLNCKTPPMQRYELLVQDSEGSWPVILSLEIRPEDLATL